MAYHGGALEWVTDVIARAAAHGSGASYYGLHQGDSGRVAHFASSGIDPAASPSLRRFLDHVDVAVSVHGFGRKRLWHSLLLGGRNRALASHVARELRGRLPDYDVLDDLEAVPAELAGQHPRNPVNLPTAAGVQIELPPTIVGIARDAIGATTAKLAGLPRCKRLSKAFLLQPGHGTVAAVDGGG